jgi:hypothetical protein
MIFLKIRLIVMTIQLIPHKQNRMLSKVGTTIIPMAAVLNMAQPLFRKMN